MKTKPITLFVPFTKIERRESDDALIVEGYCFVNPTVKGDRYSIKRSAMEAATPDYLKFPAVREMHQPIAAGTGLEVIWDDKGCLLRSECVDEGTKRKIDKKVLRGYSIGVGDLFVNRADEVERLTWIETSYVDRPKDPDAVFLYRAEGFDPEQEVEVTVLEDEVPGDTVPGSRCPVPGGQEPVGLLSEPGTGHRAPGTILPPGTGHRAPGTILPSSPAAVAPDPEAAAVSDPAESLHPSLSSTSEDIPSAVREPAEGDSSHTEEQRAALLAAGLPEGMLAGVEVVQAGLQPQTITVGGSTAVPVTSTVQITPAEVARGIAEMADAERAQTSETVPVRANLEPKHREMVERFVKQKGERWCVYSESGDELGCHDTHAEAVDQLQAIEASKDKKRAAVVDPKRVVTITTELEAMVARATELQREMAGEPPAAAPPVAPGPAVETPPAATEVVRYLPGNDSFELTQENGDSFIITRYAAETLARYGSREEAEGRLAELHADAVERGAAIRVDAATETVSRTDVRDEPTELQRLETANAELTQRLAAYEETLTRLAAAEAEVQKLKPEVERLRNAPLDREKPVVRYPHALSREFIANLGNEGEARIKVLRADYEAAKKEAEDERRGDRDKLNRAVERMILRATQLAEHGVYVE